MFLLSDEVVEELRDVLLRDRFDRYVQRKVQTEFLRALILKATLVDIVEHIQVCRDPKDDRFLELSVNGKASSVISGDIDLIALNPFR